MGLPAQVQAQLDAAEALQAQLAQPAPAEAVVNTETPAANTEPGPTEPTSVAPATTEPAPAAEPKNDDAYAQLEQRYKSLQGMWQSSAARLQKAEQQNAELSDKLTQAITKLESLAAPAQPTAQTESLVTDKDAEAFGTDLIDLARRVAKEQFGEREQQLLGQIQKLEQRLVDQDAKLGTVTETQVATAQERFYASLDGSLATWEQIQATPECQQWLQTRVPGARHTWNQALLGAANDFDAPRALEVFDTFLAANPTLDPRKKAPAPAPQSKRDELQRQVAPSKSGAATSTPQGKKVYSAREYEQGMNQVVQLGKMRQYDEQAALENELNAALAEGRVTP